MTRRPVLIAFTSFLLAVSVTSCGEDGGEPVEFRTQISTASADSSFTVATAANGDVVIAGSTEGDLAGTNAGARDVYLARLDQTGAMVWERQLGGPKNDSPLGVSIAPDGSIYVAGFSEGDFAATNRGSADVWIARFDDDGTEVWRSQFGGPEWDRGFDVSAHAGGAYVTGYTAGVLDPHTDRDGFDGFAASFDADGNQQWVRQYGTDATDWGQGSAAAEDGLYITGYTEGAFEGQTHLGDKDAFVLHMSSTGDIEWVRQFGSEGLDWTQGVGIGSDGGPMVAGSTEGSVGSDGAGGRDVLIAAFEPDGTQRFVTQLGTAENDSVFEVRLVDDLIVASGQTGGDLAGRAGDRDAILVWLSDDGSLVEVQQFGTAGVDEATGLDAGRNGDVRYSGYTSGNLVSTNLGGTDIVVGAAPIPS